MRALIEMPRLMAAALALEPKIEAMAHELAKARDVLYLGRGTRYPAGARRRAEAQGNLLHPRRRLCGRRAEARPDRADRREHAGRRGRAARRVFEKTLSNMQEVAARGGSIILITDARARRGAVESMLTLMCRTCRKPWRRWSMRCRCSCSRIIPPS